MRRAWSLVLSVAALALTGCTGNTNVDGNLTDEWAAMPSAAYDLPTVGQCLAGGAFQAFQPEKAQRSRVDCAEEHVVEIVGLAEFTGAFAGLPALPAWDSDATRAAYATCDKAVQQHIGGDWRVGRLVPYLSLPDEKAWAGGNRNYVCGVAEAADDMFAAKPRTGSVKDSLAGAKPLALTCVVLRGSDVSVEGFYGTVDKIEPIDCAQPHDTEFVGLYTAPAGKYPDRQALQKSVGDACYAKIATYLGITQNELYQRGDVYMFWNGLQPEQWGLGDRTAHCFANVSSKKLLTKSLKGLGTKALPTG